jgi:hypothetical protein
MGQVLMRHPNFPDRAPVEVDEQAFNVAWEKKGWELVNPYAEPNTDPEKTRLPVLETVSEPELRGIAEDLGIERADDLTGNELRSLISNTPDFYDQPTNSSADNPPDETQSPSP